jgi:hypothetical protein
LVIDWVPVVQFALQIFLTTPLNFKWQEFLEETWPGTHQSPTKEAVAAAAHDDDKALDRSARDGTLVKPKLNVANTVTKTVLDQTVGAAVNAFLFAALINFVRAAMVRPAHLAEAHHSGALVLSRAGYDFDAVDYADVLARARADFWPVLVASWRFWPFVSVVSFSCLQTVMARTILGNAAAFVWGIYVSLVL